MKKLLFLSLAAGVLYTTLTACSNDETLAVDSNGTTAAVTLSTTIPSTMQTRSFGDGTTATVLDYAVYKVDKSDDTKLTLVSSYYDAASFSDKAAKVVLDLAYGFNYKIVLFARADGSDMTVTFNANAATLSMPYSDSNTTLNANDEGWDCFYAVYETGIVTGVIQDVVPLYRPMAQLSIGTSDLTSETVLAVFENNLDDLTVSVTLPAGLPTQLDLFTDKASSVTTKEITLSYTGDPRKLDTGDFPVEPSTYDYVFMTYLLPGVTEDITENAVTSQTLSEVGISIKHSAMETERIFTQNTVPLERNCRTNLYGALLSATSNDTDYDGAETAEDSSQLTLSVGETGSDTIPETENDEVIPALDY